MSGRNFQTERIMSKSKPSLSSEEQKTLASEAVRRMNDVRQAMSSPEAREDYFDFIIDFTICEVGYKTLLESYLESQGKSYSADNLKSNLIRFLTYSNSQISSSTKRTEQRYSTNTLEKQGSMKRAA